jgi:putative tryptophan/tyrosine transport system substrate-binding protein
MHRREFITLLGGAVTSPHAARAQQAAVPVIGFLHVRSPDNSAPQVAGFRRGLAESGYVEGQNVTIEYRWVRGQYDQLPAMAAELVRWPIDVFVAGADAAALSAKAATSTIPIFFSVGSDPVKLGLVASFNRPGGNVTGMNILTTRLEAKRLGLLHELVRYAASFGVLLHPGAPDREGQLRDVQEAGRAIGVPIHALWASTDREIDATFDTVVQQHIAALAVTANPFFDTRRDQILALAARHTVPAMYQFREYAAAGGLMSYGIDLPDVYRQVGAYVGRILKGAKPAELPVLLPTKFELVINLKTAKALGLTVPDKLLAIADEVIE